MTTRFALPESLADLVDVTCACSKQAFHRKLGRGLQVTGRGFTASGWHRENFYARVGYRCLGE